MAAPTSAAPLAREDAAWLAGLLDGEGCFDAPRGNPRLRVKMTDFDVVYRAADVMGATTHVEHDHRLTVTGAPRSSLLAAQLSGDRAVSIMRAVLPWLGARRSQKVSAIITADAARKTAKLADAAARKAAPGGYPTVPRQLFPLVS